MDMIVAHQIKIDRGQGFAFISLSGQITGNELVQTIRELLSSPDWRLTDSVLWDGSRIKSVSVDPDELNLIRGTVRAYNDRRGSGKAAFVVARDVDRTMATQIKALLQHPKRDIRVFDSVDDARDWLGVAKLPE